MFHIIKTKMWKNLFKIINNRYKSENWCAHVITTKDNTFEEIVQSALKSWFILQQ